MNLEIDASEPYEEGIKYDDDVCHSVNRRKLSQ